MSYKSIREKNPDALRHGEKWTSQEEFALLEFMHENKSISEISKILDRTPNSVRMRIEMIIVEYYYNNNYSIDEIHVRTNVNKVDIANIIEKHKDKFIIKPPETPKPTEQTGWLSNIFKKIENEFVNPESHLRTGRFLNFKQ